MSDPVVKLEPVLEAQSKSEPIVVLAAPQLRTKCASLSDLELIIQFVNEPLFDPHLSPVTES